MLNGSFNGIEFTFIRESIICEPTSGKMNRAVQIQDCDVKKLKSMSLRHVTGELVWGELHLGQWVLYRVIDNGNKVVLLLNEPTETNGWWARLWQRVKRITQKGAIT